MTALLLLLLLIPILTAIYVLANTRVGSGVPTCKSMKG
jgi:hypothetical protein